MLDIISYQGNINQKKIYSYKITVMAKIKKKDNSTYWRGFGENRALI